MHRRKWQRRKKKENKNETTAYYLTHHIVFLLCDAVGTAAAPCIAYEVINFVAAAADYHRWLAGWLAIEVTKEKKKIDISNNNKNEYWFKPPSDFMLMIAAS